MSQSFSWFARPLCDRVWLRYKWLMFRFRCPRLGDERSRNSHQNPRYFLLLSTTVQHIHSFTQTFRVQSVDHFQTPTIGSRKYLINPSWHPLSTTRFVICSSLPRRLYVWTMVMVPYAFLRSIFYFSNLDFQKSRGKVKILSLPRWDIKQGNPLYRDRSFDLTILGGSLYWREKGWLRTVEGFCFTSLLSSVGRRQSGLMEIRSSVVVLQVRGTMYDDSLYPSLSWSLINRYNKIP